MFSLKDKLVFINVNQDYLKYLHDYCPEVYFKTVSYENKPYLGILINDGEMQYVIPLSSAKQKHKAWKNIDSDRFLIFEKCNKDNVSSKAICKEMPDGSIEHLLSVIDLKKMIPIMVIQKANKLYEKQMNSGRVIPFCCDFKLLEEKCIEYKSS